MNSEKKLLLTGLALAGTSVLAAAGAEAKSPAKEKDRPNVLFILCDQWRKQALGYMHADPVQTPNLDALSTWAFSFDNAVASNPVSGPNRGCIFTGKYTINNGLWANSACVDPNDKAGMGTIFKNAGYSTGYVGKWHMNGINDAVTDPSRRLGFDYWYQTIAHNHFRPKIYAPEESGKIFTHDGWGPTNETDKAIAFMKRQKDDPFLLVVSYAPPHTGGGPGFEDRFQPGKAMKLGYGYAGPAEYEALYTDDYERHPIRPNIRPTGSNPETDSYAPAVPGYFGAITSLDHEIGRMIDYLRESGQLENTLIIFTADHGEMMGSQGLMTKGVPFEESEGIPMLFAWKGKIRPARETCVFNSIDLIPTMASLARIKVEDVDGTDYSPLLLGKRFKAPTYTFTEFNFGGIGEKGRPWRCVFSEDYVYMLLGPGKLRSNFFNEGYVLFDRKKDPYQLHPIVKGMGYDEVIAKYHEVLAAHLQETGDPFISDMWNCTVDELPAKPHLNKENHDPALTDEVWKERIESNKRKIREGAFDK